ncbi:ribose-phosphate pyrophosphokinase [candidate division WOR-3 bacterium]|nr:ribose-phosphate pyrophosphokinase [candidate division WOR-3 bacterium]
MYKKLKIFAGNSNLPLAREIAEHMERPLGSAIVTRFSDGEIWVKLNENVRGADVFIIQPTFPPSDNLMELLILIDAVKRASAKRITAVIPYYGYARQDKKDEPRVPISAKLIANLLTTAGANRVLTVDLHSETIQGFFDIPVDHLYAEPVLVEYIKSKNMKNIIVVSPDAGSVKRARHFARRLGDVPIAIIDKRRPRPNQAEVMNIVGNVKGKNCIIIDDIVDTAGTLVGAAKALKKKDVESITVCCTHSLLSGNAIERIASAEIDQFITTNTIPIVENKRLDKMVVLSLASLLSKAINIIHEEKSLSTLFY